MSQPADPPASGSSVCSSSAMPDHRALYLLLAGIVLGILLGPAVLGRWAPATYQQLFIGASAARDELVRFEEQAKVQKLEQQTKFAQQIHDLQQTGVTDVALEELKQKQTQQRQELEQKHELTRQVILASRIEPAMLDHARKIQGIMNSLFATLIVISILQSLLTPGTPGSPHFTSVGHPPASPLARYRLGLAYGQIAIAALWIALLLAQPTLLANLNVIMMGILLFIALLAALIPWSKSA